jgi:hypothetical protein
MANTQSETSIKNEIEPKAELMDQRVTIMMSKSELASIDDWRAERRIWSRGNAIRQLVFSGMAVADSPSGGDVVDASGGDGEAQS